MGKTQKSCKNKDKAYRPYDHRDIQTKKKKGKRKMNSFFWSMQQENRYVQFLSNNRILFSNFEKRKKNRVFVLMSEYLQKRRPDQCRSHHQKMELKYRTIDQIIEGITKNKLKTQQTAEKDINFTLTFKSISNTATQIIEQKNQIENCREVANEIETSPKNFLVQEKELWDCLLDNVWSY